MVIFAEPLRGSVFVKAAGRLLIKDLSNPDSGFQHRLSTLDTVKYGKFDLRLLSISISLLRKIGVNSIWDQVGFMKTEVVLVCQTARLESYQNE